MGKQTVNVKCSFCGKDKILKQWVYNRRIKLNKHKFYCNCSCSAKDNESLKLRQKYNREHPEECRERIAKYVHLAWGKGGRRADEFSDFKYLIRTANRLKKFSIRKRLDFNLDTDYLKDLWETQKGICPYTGIKMELCRPISKNRIRRRVRIPNSASLDRIDSAKGYIKGNVEFVCYSVNLAKNDFTREEMLNFFNSIRSIHSNLWDGQAAAK